MRVQCIACAERVEPSYHTSLFFLGSEVTRGSGSGAGCRVPGARPCPRAGCVGGFLSLLWTMALVSLSREKR